MNNDKGNDHIRKGSNSLSPKGPGTWAAAGLLASLALYVVALWAVWQGDGRSHPYLSNDYARTALWVTGGLMAGPTAALTIRRQRSTEQTVRVQERTQATMAEAQKTAADAYALDLERADHERVSALHDRETEVITQLGSPAPGIRCAALRRLAGIADEWVARGELEKAQVCVTVIVGQLRAIDDKGQPIASTTSEQQTVASIVRERFTGDCKWRDLVIEIRDTTISTWMNLEGMKLQGKGSLRFVDCTILSNGGVNASNFEVTESSTAENPILFSHIELYGHIEVSKGSVNAGEVVLSFITLRGNSRLWASAIRRSAPWRFSMTRIIAPPGPPRYSLLATEARDNGYPVDMEITVLPVAS